MNLRDAQARFCQLVTAREDVAAIAGRLPSARAAVEELVVGDARLSAVERLDIYGGMYFVRIHDVLVEELPRTAAVLGGEAFHGLVTDYLQACPPDQPSLREVGARLPAFLATHACAADRPWVADLARLERARLEVFDGPDVAPVRLATLREVPPERFGALRLRLVASHRLLDNRAAIAAVWRGEDPNDVPPRAEPETLPETLIVWRREGTVYHRVVDADEVRWLPRLAGTQGILFGELCAGLGADLTDEAAAARAFELLARWAAEELLVVD